MTKQEYVDKLKKELDDWNYKWSVEHQKLEAKAQKAEAALKAMISQEISEIQEKRNRVREKIAEINLAGESAWEDLKEGAQASWNDLVEASNKAKSRFK
jgi:multidrug resistance efflux pump